MRLRPPFLRAAGPVLAVATTLAVSSCGGGSVEFEGTGVGNADAVLVDADDAFGDVVEQAVADGTTTVSDESRCYFKRAGEDGVDDAVFCGPVRVVGAAEDDAWYTFAVYADGSTDEGLRLGVTTDGPAELTAVSDDDLFRPDGAEPVAAADLDEPQAPEAPVADVAVTLGDTTGLEFEPLAEPYELVTPSMTLTVEAAASMDVVPANAVGAVQSDGDDDTEADTEADAEAEPSASVPFFRPAEGQKVAAWRLTVGPPPTIAPGESDEYVFGADDRARDASTALAVAAGDQHLAVSGALTEVTCEQVPCPQPDQSTYALVASFAEDTAPALVATVDGTSQSLSLDDGTITSDVSQVAYDRESLTQQVSKVWPSTTFSVRTAEQLEKDQGCCFDNTTYTFGGEVQTVHLTPFDFARGWAPSGKAWLVVPVVNRPEGFDGDWSAEVSLDARASMTLTVGDAKLPAQPDAGAEGSTVFLVDDGFTTGTVTYSPKGSVMIGERTYPLKTDKSLTLDVTFP